MDTEHIVQRMFDHYNHHDVDALMALVGPDLRFVDHPQALTLDRDQFAVWLAEGMVTFPDVALTQLRHVASETTVISRFVEEATHLGPLPTPDGEIPPTGRRVSLPICFVLEVGPDGLIHGGETYYDVDTMLRQITTAPSHPPRD